MKIRKKMFMRILATILTLITATTIWANSLPVKGCIAVFQKQAPIYTEVELPAFSGGIFRTDQFHFSNLPQDMMPDDKGRYCYSMQDERFAFVHTYYYAIKEMEDYRRIFEKLNLPMKINLKWKLYKDSTSPTSGFSDSEISYPNLFPDPSTIQHEMGHVIHAAAAGDADKRKGFDFIEGTANIIAVLHSGNTIIGGYDAYAASYDINTFLQFPDHIITSMQILKNIIADPIFNLKYPEYIAKIKPLLNADPVTLEELNAPDPYVTSSVINQPLWQAALIFQVETIKIIYIKTLSTLTENKNYSYTEIANALINQAYQLNPEIGFYLKHEFELRGIPNLKFPFLKN